MARLKDCRAFRHIFSGEPPIRAPLQAAWNEDGSAAFDAAVFLHGDGVAPFRHYRAGENADRPTLCSDTLHRLACGCTTCDRENRPFSYVVIFEGEGIAIDSGARVRRNRARRSYGFCANAGDCGKDACRFLFRYRSDETSQKCNGFLVKEPALRKRETIVGSDHVQRLRFERCNWWWSRMKSAIASVSSSPNIGR